MTLEPCPFCGEQCAEIEVTQGMKWGGYVPGCLEVRTGYNMDDDAPWRGEAATAWNTRAPDSRITELEQPCEPGSFAGDIWYGHPEKRTLGTHRWDGSAWQELPSEIEGCLSLLADARARIADLTAEVARKDEALRRLAYWFDTDADYLAGLSEAECADNNRMLSIARAALEASND